MESNTIIVKKIKKGGHGHHGGAWKVAFADFVTAMMAFFLLLWLIASTTKEERAGISEYFSPPTQGLAAGAGTQSDIIDLGGGQKISEGDESKQDARKPSVDTIKEAVEAEKKRLESLMEELKKAIEESQALKPFKDQLLLDITPEGLRIQIVDKENRPMFDSGSAQLKSYTKEILHELAKTINTVPNKISLTGHTDAAKFVGRQGYSNWELSADRANASRRELVVGGLNEAKIAKVVGLAAMVPFNKDDPRSPINRRIAIIVMNKAAEDALLNDAKEAEALINGENPSAEETPAAESHAVKRSLSGAIAERRITENQARQEAVAKAKPVAKPKPKPVAEPAPTAAPEPAAADEPAPGKDVISLPVINPIALPAVPSN